jgi:hypothetical protein
MRKAAAVPRPDWNVVRAGLLNTIKQPSMIAALAAPLVGFGAARIDASLAARRDAKEKAQAYQGMMDLHPQLRQRGDVVPRVYNTLYSVSPTLARDPLVAGEWVNNVVENTHAGYGGHPAVLNMVKEFAGVEGALQGNRQRTQRNVGANVAERVRAVGTLADQIGNSGFQVRRAEILAAHKAALKRGRTFTRDETQRLNAIAAGLNAREEALMKREKNSSATTELGALLAALKV